MRVPFIDLKRSVERIRDQVLLDWTSCLDNCEFVGGPSVQKLEKTLSQFLDSEHVISCANGTDALVIGLQALGIKPGMKVALPNMTFWAPFEAVVQIGATPVLVDINPDDLQMDFEEFKTGFQQHRYDAAILVHLFGWTSARLADFRQFCRENNVRLLEDGAQSFGVKNRGQSVYTEAEVATISFYPAKVLGAGGDAGAIMTPDPKRAEMIRSLCNHGRAGHYTYDYVGWNSRLSGVQATFLLRMLEHVQGFIDSRLEAERFYYEFFSQYPEHCRVYRAPEGVTGNGYLIVIESLTQTGDELAAKLKDYRIGCARTYPQTLGEQRPARGALATSDLRHSQRLSRMVINLPLFAGITRDECQLAADSLLKAFESGR
jgi:UDP-2-acetamido-2-deoxy-ribo-hexuluronate aminotransferase